VPEMGCRRPQWLCCGRARRLICWLRRFREMRCFSQQEADMARRPFVYPLLGTILTSCGWLLAQEPPKVPTENHTQRNSPLDNTATDELGRLLKKRGYIDVPILLSRMGYLMVSASVGGKEIRTRSRADFRRRGGRQPAAGAMMGSVGRRGRRRGRRSSNPRRCGPVDGMSRRR
jgi:hypothetical protein